MISTSRDVFSSVQREPHVRLKTSGSLSSYERACASLAGGVSSGLRRAQRPHPLYFDHGAGSRLWDVDGNEYVDYTLAWGPLILGHAHPAINEAVATQLSRGHTFGAQHDFEYRVSELLQQIIPCAERICYANSGTEIVQVALRLARAATGRPLFLKFEGHYHGWDDSVLVSYHPPLPAIESYGNQPIPVGEGQRPHKDAIIAQWNDPDSVTSAFSRYGDQISCILCEPMLCNSGCIEPQEGFLSFLRDITLRYRSLLVFDEVITGFRLKLGGAQEHYGVTPDLATFAKAIAGGLPLSALAGTEQVMQPIAAGKVVHAGTLNGNPLALAAADATLRTLAADEGAVYRRMWALGDRLRIV